MVASAAAPTEGSAAQRRCIVTGEVRDRGSLLRFVVGPDGAIVPDVAARLPGRGLWLTARRDIVERRWRNGSSRAQRGGRWLGRPGLPAASRACWPRGAAMRPGF